MKRTSVICALLSALVVLGGCGTGHEIRVEYSQAETEQGEIKTDIETSTSPTEDVQGTIAESESEKADEPATATSDPAPTLPLIPESSPVPPTQTTDQSKPDPSDYPEMMVTDTKTYLGLRSAPEKAENETGQLKNGSVVNVINQNDDEFWYVYSQELDMYGYVTGRYLIGLPPVYEADASFSFENHFGTIMVPVPQIRMDTPEIQSINREIADDFLAFHEEMERSECMGVYYEWHVNGDILSLVIQKEYMNDGRSFYVKNVSMSQKRPAAKDEVLECRGIGREQFAEMAADAITGHITELSGGGNENDREYIERSASEDNISAAIPYLNGNSELMISTKFYYPAGAGTHNALFNLDTGEIVWNVENKTVTATKHAVGFQTTLNLRETPNEDAWILGSIPLNEEVGVLYTVDNTYTRVKYRGLYGYVKSAYLGDVRMAGDYGAAFAEILRGGDQTYWDDARFQLTDLDRDGTPELIVSQGFAHVCNVEIYAYINGQTCFAGNVGSFGNVGYAPSSGMLRDNYSGMGFFTETIFKFEQGGLTEQYKISGTLDSELGQVIDHASIHGAEADESDFDEVERAIDGFGPYYSIGYDTGWEVDASNIQSFEADPERFLVDTFS